MGHPMSGYLVYLWRRLQTSGFQWPSPAAGSIPTGRPRSAGIRAALHQQAWLPPVWSDTPQSWAQSLGGFAGGGQPRREGGPRLDRDASDASGPTTACSDATGDARTEPDAEDDTWHEVTGAMGVRALERCPEVLDL